MKYPLTKILIVFGTIAGVVAIWGTLMWPEWHPKTPGVAAPAVAEQAVATAPPPTPTPLPITPAPTPTPMPPIIVKQIVYVPVSGGDGTSADGTTSDAQPYVPPAEEAVNSAPPPDAAAAPAPAPAPVPAPAPAPQPTPRPVVTPPPVPAPTPIHSGGS